MFRIFGLDVDLENFFAETYHKKKPSLSVLRTEPISCVPVTTYAY